MRLWLERASVLLIPLFLSQYSLAQTFVGTFVAVKGDVKILKSPASNNEKGPFALFEGNQYAYESAKIGKKVFPDMIVQSGADGRAKVVYPNGDQFIIGNGTSIVMPRAGDPSQKNSSSSLKLMFGRVRSLISKTGPRNNLKVSTPVAVAGVRGTDFFTRSNPTVGTELTVLRGEVHVRSAQSPEEAVSVKSGSTAEAKPNQNQAPKIVKTTQENLVQLQGESEVSSSESELSELSVDTKNEIKSLTVAAKSAVMNDIKSTDKALYEELKSREKLDLEEINAAVVAKVKSEAPRAVKRQLSDDEIKNMGEDIYKENFK